MSENVEREIANYQLFTNIQLLALYEELLSLRHGINEKRSNSAMLQSIPNALEIVTKLCNERGLDTSEVEALVEAKMKLMQIDPKYLKAMRHLFPFSIELRKGKYCRLELRQTDRMAYGNPVSQLEYFDIDRPLAENILKLLQEVESKNENAMFDGISIHSLVSAWQLVTKSL